jgi:hypothetical protein
MSFDLLGMAAPQAELRQRQSICVCTNKGALQSHGL